MKLPDTPGKITTIGGAYGTDVTNSPLAKAYGIQTAKMKGKKNAK